MWKKNQIIITALAASILQLLRLIILAGGRDRD